MITMMMRWVNLRVLVHEWLIEESDHPMISLAQNILSPTNKKNNQKMEETNALVEMFQPFFFRFVKWIFLKDHQTIQAPKMKGSSPIEAVWIWPM